MKAHIFLIANLKFCLQTPCSFGDMAENVKLIGIPINNFLCIYIIASSPGLHTLFCLWRVNKKLPQGETSQNTFQRSRSISWKCKIHMVKWAHPPLSWTKRSCSSALPGVQARGVCWSSYYHVRSRVRVFTEFQNPEQNFYLVFWFLSDHRPNRTFKIYNSHWKKEKS